MERKTSCNVPKFVHSAIGKKSEGGKVRSKEKETKERDYMGCVGREGGMEGEREREMEGGKGS